MIIKDVSKTYGKIGRAQKMFNFLKLHWDALYLTVFIYVSVKYPTPVPQELLEVLFS